MTLTLSRPLAVFAAALLSTATLASSGEIALIDDTGNAVKLAAPAQRIVSLAPHLTEVLYAAGAGAALVGSVDYADYPPAAKALPRVGGYSRLDLEAVVALKPDLIVAWQSGNAAAALTKLRALGLPVYVNQPGKLLDVAHSIEQLGRLAGTSAVAETAAARFRERHAQYATRYSGRPKVRVFYQVWKQPLTTINGRQIISDVIRLCGGENVFAELPVLAPTVTAEAVLAANPEVIVASGMGTSRPEWLDDWRRWPSLTAVAKDNLYFVQPDLIQRHTPRVLDGAEQLCGHLETARAKLGKK